MKKETVKTVAGIIVIAAIVVATYLYGSHQRQAQLDREQTARQQEQTASSTASASPSATTKATDKTNTGTAPVASVQPNTIQGGTTSSPTPTITTKPSASVPSVSVSQGSVSATSVDNTQTLAQTGSSLTTTAELALIGFVGLGFVRSRRAVVAAVRNPR